MPRKKTVELTKPYDFQVKANRKVEELDGRALVSLDMGLGKTRVSLMYAFNHPELRPAVVVCPASLKWNWQAECEKHYGWSADVLNTTRPPPRSRWKKKHNIVIVNYNILGQRRNDDRRKKVGPGWLGYLQAIQPKLVILDEAHAISNRTAKQTKWVRELCMGVNHVLALTGTPILNRPADLWTILNLLRPELYPNFYSYGHAYCAPYKSFFGWQFKGASNLDHLNRTLKKTMMVRMRKVDVLKDLPDKVRSTVPVELPLKGQKEYKHAQDNFVEWLEAKHPDKAAKSLKAEAVTQLGYLKRLAAQLKLPLVIEWVNNFLQESDGKLVLFAYHTPIIRALEKQYKKQCVVLDGHTPVKDRKAIVRKFQVDKKCRIFIGQIRAAGVGLNLTEANTVAFAELDWVPAIHTQAEDRCHRIGTKSSVNVYYLIARGTIEEKLVKIIQTKQRTINKAIDGGEVGDDLNVYDQLLEQLKKGNQT